MRTTSKIGHKAPLYAVLYYNLADVFEQEA